MRKKWQMLHIALEKLASACYFHRIHSERPKKTMLHRHTSVGLVEGFTAHPHTRRHAGSLGQGAGRGDGGGGHTSGRHKGIPAPGTHSGRRSCSRPQGVGRHGPKRKPPTTQRQHRRGTLDCAPRHRTLGNVLGEDTPKMKSKNDRKRRQDKK